MARSKPKRAVTRTSFYVTDALLRAMRAVEAAERVNHTGQIQMGLLLYLDRHRALLESKGIHLWPSAR